MNKEITNILADCFAFLDVKPSNSLECYIFENDHWQFFQNSVHEVYHSPHEAKKFLKVLEDFFFEFEINGWLSNYLRNKKKYKEKFGSVVDFDIVTSPILIHKKINETKSMDELKILFAFYLEHISSSDLLRTICYKNSNDKDGSISFEPYNIKEQGNRLPEVFLKLIELSELSLKINKYTYTYDLCKLELIIQNNKRILCEYLQNRNIFHSIQLRKERANSNNVYNIYEIYIENCVRDSLRKIAVSNLYSDFENFYSNYGDLYDCLNEKPHYLQSSFEKPQPTIRCILFEKAKNAYKYGIISRKKLKKYESKLKGKEHKQITRNRENLLIENYVAKDNKKPIFRSSKWSSLNKKFYKNKLEKSFRKEEEIDINFNSGFYSRYLSEYVKQTCIKTYKIGKKNYLEKNSCHLSRVLKMYGNADRVSTRAINIVKGMLLDAGKYEKYNQLTKWSLVFSTGSDSIHSTYEIISVQNELGDILPFSGELFISQIGKEKYNKLFQLFSDDIITYLNNYIESEGNYLLPLELFQKFSDPVFTEKKFDEIKKFWIEERFNRVTNFKFDKKTIISRIREFSLDYEKTGIYFERFSLLNRNNVDTSFDLVKVPRISIPNELIFLVKVELHIIYKNLINGFKKERELHIGDDRWISEKHLLQRVRENFPELTIISHASPEWLGRQHFDIYIPSKQVAIEYNGRQHYQPIEYFGGKEGFNRIVELDRRKIRIAHKNNCTVIIHKFDEDIEITLKRLNNYIDN